MKKRFYLTYPPELIKEPFIYQVGKLYKVVTNIRQANISDKLGLVALELEGEAGEIDKAVKFLYDKGIKVEPIELDVIE
ncbi:MAG: NIL domain-containing protein [Deltaproteobacteria bacterium]